MACTYSMEINADQEKQMIFLEETYLINRYTKKSFINVMAGKKYAYGLPKFATMSAKSGKASKIFIPYAQIYYPNVAQTKHSKVLNSHNGIQVRKKSKNVEQAFLHMHQIYESEYPNSSNSIREEIRVRFSDIVKAYRDFAIDNPLINSKTSIYFIPSQLFAKFQLRLLEKFEWLSKEADTFNVTAFGSDLLFQYVSNELRYLIGYPTHKSAFSLARTLDIDETSAFRIARAICWRSKTLITKSIEAQFKTVTSIHYDNYNVGKFFKNDIRCNLKKNYLLFESNISYDHEKMMGLFLECYFSKIPKSTLKEPSLPLQNPSFHFEYLKSICNHIRIGKTELDEVFYNSAQNFWFPDQGKIFDGGRTLKRQFAPFYDIYGACSNKVRADLRAELAKNDYLPFTKKENDWKPFTCSSIKGSAKLKSVTIMRRKNPSLSGLNSNGSSPVVRSRIMSGNVELMMINPNNLIYINS